MHKNIISAWDKEKQPDQWERLNEIIDERNPVRIGFSLGNEFSDHETEQINYLYLAHSKLRNCSVTQCRTIEGTFI